MGSLFDSTDLSNFENVKDASVQEIEFMRNSVDKRKNALLCSAAGNGFLAATQFLIENGADIHIRDDFALGLSAHGGHFEVVKYLIENGANIHARNGNAFLWSSHNGHLEVVKYLIENGANVSAQNDLALRWSAKNASRSRLELRFTESEM